LLPSEHWLPLPHLQPPAVQVSERVLLQPWHWPPLMPQSVLVVPAKHTPDRSQQPWLPPSPGQVLGPQLLQAPPAVQLSPVEQAMHALPPAPHWEDDVEVTHWPVLEQQPLQPDWVSQTQPVALQRWPLGQTPPSAVLLHEHLPAVLQWSAWLLQLWQLLPPLPQ